MRSRLPLIAFLFSILIGSSVASFQSFGSGGIMLSALICSPTSQAAIGSCIGSVYSNAIALASIGILLSLVIVAISYMVGNLLNIRGFKDWYKGELWETIKSLLLIAIIFSALTIAGGISSALAGSPTTSGTSLVSHFDGLWTTSYKSYLLPTLQSSSNAVDAILGLSVGVGALKSINYNLELTVTAFYVSLISGSEGNIYVSSILDSATKGSFLQILADTVVMVEIVFAMLSQMFYAIVGIGLVGFIPIGIILRAFPMLRGLGGTFIAMGIGLSLIFPTLLVTFNLPVTNYIDSAVLGAQPISSNSQPGFTTTTSFIQGAMSIVVNPILKILGGVTIFLTGFTTGLFESMFGVYSVLNYAMYYSLISVLQFILLVIDIVVGIILTGSIAKMLGGSVKLGIGKFKIA